MITLTTKEEKIIVKETTLTLELVQKGSNRVELDACIDGYRWHLLALQPDGIHRIGCISKSLGFDLDGSKIAIVS